MNGKPSVKPGPPPRTASPATRRSGWGWLLLGVLLVVLAAGGAGTGAALWWRGRTAPIIPEPEKPDNVSPQSRTTEDLCSDDDDPKYLEPLQFGKPVEVEFQPRFLDALKKEAIPEVEIYPWQPTGLVAVLGEHRMRGNLIAASPDGKLLAVGSTGSGFIRIGPVSTLHETAILTSPAYPLAMAWSPTGKTLAVSGHDGVVRLHDIANLESIPEPRSLPREAGAGLISCLSFSSDGKYLLGGDNTALNGTGWVWDVAGRKVKARLSHVGPVTSVAFSPVKGDYRALTGGGAGDGYLRLWEAETGNTITKIDCRPSKTDMTTGVEGVAFSPDAKRALSCHPNGMIRVWDLTEFKPGLEVILRDMPAEAKRLETHVYGNHVGAALAVFSPDGKYIASGRYGDGGIWLWEAGQVKQVRRLAVPSGLSGLHFLTSDRIVFAGTVSHAHNIHVLEVASSKELLPPVGHLAGLSSVALAPDGRLVASGGHDVTVRTWDMDGPKQRHSLGFSNSAHVGFTPDSRRVSYFSPSVATLGLADVQTGRGAAPAWSTRHSGGIHSIAWTVDGQYVATGGYHDGSVRLWRLQDGQQVRQFLFSPNPGAAMVSLAPDMRRALRVGGGHVRLLQLRCQQEKHDWKGNWSWAPFLPDGRAVFLGGADAPMWQISKDDPKEAGRLALDLRKLNAGYLTPDGKRLAAVHSGRVVVHDIGTTEAVWQWTPPAHFGRVTGVSLSPNGRYLATANGDGTAYVIRLP